MKPKRILSLLLTLALCLSLVPLEAVPARAAGGGERDYWAQNKKSPVFDSIYSYLLNNYDADGDKHISLSEMDLVTELDCADLEVGELRGLQLLQNVTRASFAVNDPGDPYRSVAINDRVYYATTARIIIRKGSGSAYEQVAILEAGTIVDVIAASGWLKIGYTGNNGFGYINSDYCVEVTRTNTVLSYLSCWGDYYLKSLDVSRVPNLADAVINGVKDDSSPDYDRFVSDKGELRVDKETRLIVGAPVDVELPTIVVQPEDRVVTPGTELKFRVNVSGGEGPYKFMWFYRASESDDWHPAPGQSGYLIDALSSSLPVTASAELDGRQYYCAIYDRYSNRIASDIVTLKVTDTFTIERQPKDVTVHTGETAAFSAKAAVGTLPFTYQWYCRSDPSGPWTPVAGESGQANTYSFTAREAQNGYQYYCAAKDADGATAETRTATLTVTGHSLTKTNAKAANCTEDGNAAYWTCGICQKLFSDANGKTEISLNDAVIPALGHTPGDAVRENVVAATATTDGSYDEVVYCKVCKTELSRVK